MIRPLLPALAALILAALPFAARAQDFNFASGGGAPVEITSDAGLELSQDARTVTAHGHAKATRGNVTVSADELIAYYRPKGGAATPPSPSSPPAPANGAAKPSGDANAGGDAEIWRVVADGNVSITTPTAKAIGDHAEYSIDDAVVRLSGHNLRLTTTTETVTARDSLEYWENKKQAVARGQAVALQGKRRLQADLLTANFTQNKQNQLVLANADAQSHVILTAPDEVLTGDRGNYNAESGIVTMTGSVKMNRDGNQLDGGYAIVNLNTGISRLLPAPPGVGGGGKQVRGLLEPSGIGGASKGAGVSNPASSAR